MSQYPEAYKQYLIEFHATRDFFECHELLEEYWKSTADRNRTWVGLIQIAVGFYHFRRENYVGAEKMLKSAESQLAAGVATGLNMPVLKSDLRKWISQVEQRNTYFDPSLPFIDTELLDEVIQMTTEKGYHWGSPSDLSNFTLIHRHTTRDRTDVIEARQQSLIQKRSISIDNKF